MQQRKRTLLFFGMAMATVMVMNVGVPSTFAVNPPPQARGTENIEIPEDAAPTYSEATWNANLPDLRSRAAAGLPVDAPLGDMGWQTLSLSVIQLFDTGQQKVEIVDENGTVLDSYPLDIGTYGGAVLGDSDSRVSLTVDNVGVYGYVRFLNTTYDFMPASDQIAANPANASVLVRWLAEPSPDLTPIGDPVHEALGVLPIPVETMQSTSASANQAGSNTAKSGSSAETKATSGSGSCTGSACPRGTGGSGGSGGGSGGGGGGGGGGGSSGPGPSECHGTTPTGFSGYNALCVKPVADKKFQNAASNWASRITSALNVQVSMWQNYPGILFYSRSIVGYTSDYSTSNSCGNHMDAFYNNRPADSLAAGWQLFSGYSFGGAGGCAPGQDSLVECRISYRPATAITMVSVNAYNAGSSTHVGLLSGHEMGHIWGEPQHPTNTNSNGKRNIMYYAFTTSNDFWFTQASQAKIRDAARYGYCAS